MAINSTVRYAAKEAYKLLLMRGISESIQVGYHCQVIGNEVWVMNDGGGRPESWCVPIAKSWAQFL